MALKWQSTGILIIHLMGLVNCVEGRDLNVSPLVCLFVFRYTLFVW